MIDDVAILVVSRKKELSLEFTEVVEKLDRRMFHLYKERYFGYHEDQEKNRCINISIARNDARTVALSWPYKHYLWLDSDVVPH